MKRKLQYILLVSALGAGMSQAALVAHYKFDETSGTTATNSVSGATNGTVTGATINVAGKSGRAYSFDGTGDWVDAGNASFLSSLTASGELTFSAWINTNDAVGNRNVVVFAGNSSSSNRYTDLTYNGPGGVAVGRNRTATISEWFGDDLINDSAWHHIAMVINTNAGEQTIDLYVDGALDNDGTSQNTSPTGFPTLNNFEIGRLGRSSPTDYFTGLIDDVQVYDSALTATEVAFLNNNPGLAIPEPSAISLLLLLLGSLGFLRRRR